eukprot:1154179-Pelagomonas_calceolata.AAC.1
MSQLADQGYISNNQTGLQQVSAKQTLLKLSQGRFVPIPASLLISKTMLCHPDLGPASSWSAAIFLLRKLSLTFHLDLYSSKVIT